MAEKIIHEMVSAFAVGCMDKQNFVQFKDYMEKGGELPLSELGELQNITAMIPVILDLERPHPSIKDMVAKRLIGMKDEIKEKIRSDRQTMVNPNPRLTMPSITEIKPPASNTIVLPPLTTTIQSKIGDTSLKYSYPEEELTNTFADEQIAKLSKTFATTAALEEKPLDKIDIPSKETETTFTPIPKIDFSKTEVFKETNIEKTQAKELSKVTSIKQIEVDEPKLNTKILTQEVAEVADNRFQTSILPIIGMIISLLLITILGYFIFSSNQKLNDRLDDLQNDISSLQSQVNSANDFVGNNSSLVEFFNYKDIFVVNLTSADAAVQSSAKVLFSFTEKEGLIQFKNMPPLQSGQAFQLWMENKGQSYSLGTYTPKDGSYLKITTFPFVPKEQISAYKITVEQAAGVTTPSASILTSTAQRTY